MTAFGGTRRPPQRRLHATTELDAFVMVTYRVPPERLAQVIPSRFSPTVFTFDDGTSAGLVSAVAFLDRDFHFGGAPIVKVSCGQINYRVYGSLEGSPGVWFMGTSLDSAWVALPRLVWGMPWHRDRIRIDSTWDGETPERIQLNAVGAWGTAAFDLRGNAEPVDRLDGFNDRDETMEVLTHPMVGWYERRGRLGRYSVWHELLEPTVCSLTSARFDVFERPGLIESGAPPHSVLAQRTVHFDVHTPPTTHGALR